MSQHFMTTETSLDNPASGEGVLAFKSDGLYFRLHDGTEIGPLAPSAGFSVPLYLDNTASSISGYKTLTTTQPTGSVQSDSAALSAADTVINEYASTAGLFNLISKQTANVHLHLTRTAGTKGISAYVKLYHRTSGGTETQIGISSTHANVEATEEHDFDVGIASDTAFSATDVLVMKVFGTPTGSGSTPTLAVSFQGTTYSRVQFGAQITQASTSAVNPNVLPNGGFRVAQRGAGPFTNTTLFPNNDDSYQIDGCNFLANGADTCDVSQVADTDFVSGYKIRLDVETGNRRFGILLPVANKDIQDIRKSGVASLQFKVKCTGTSMGNVRAYLLSWSSTADTITSAVISAWNAAGADPTFAANWTAENAGANLSINTTIATKQIQNIAVDTAGVTNLAVLLMVDDTDASVGDFLEFGDVKLEEGASCTNYQNKPYQEELANCQRRFVGFSGDGTNYGVFGMGQWWNSTTAYISIPFPVEMAVVPHTFTYDDLTHFKCWESVSGAVVTVTGLANNYPTKKAAALAVTVAAGGSNTSAAMLSINNATDGKLYFSAEL